VCLLKKGDMGVRTIVTSFFLLNLCIESWKEVFNMWGTNIFERFQHMRLNVFGNLYCSLKGLSSMEMKEVLRGIKPKIQYSIIRKELSNHHFESTLRTLRAA